MERFFIYFILLLSLILVPPIHAATLQVEPVALTVRTDQEFTVTVNMGLQNGEKAFSTDAYLVYDPSLFEVVKSGSEYGITPGRLFSTQGHSVTNDRIYLYGIQQDKNSSTPISGTIATITLRALREGKGELRIDCQNDPNSSKIVSAALTNIIDCSTTSASKLELNVVPPGTVLGASTRREISTKPRPLVQAVVVVALVGLIALAFSNKKRRLHE